MITTETPNKLAEIIRDTWPNLYRPQKNLKPSAQLPIDPSTERRYNKY
jgi:hypothetical protein